MAKKDYPIGGGFRQEDYMEGSVLPRADPGVLRLLYNPPAEKPYQDAGARLDKRRIAIETSEDETESLTLNTLQEEEPIFNNLNLDLEYYILKEYGPQKPAMLTVVEEYQNFNEALKRWAAMHDDPYAYDVYSAHLREFAGYLEEQLYPENQADHARLAPYLATLYKEGLDTKRRLLIADPDNWQRTIREHLPLLLSLNTYAENGSVVEKALKDFKILERGDLTPEDHEMGGHIYAALTDYDIPPEQKLEYYRKGIQHYEDTLTTTGHGITVAGQYVDLVNDYIQSMNPYGTIAEETLGRARNILDYAIRNAPREHQDHIKDVKDELGNHDEDDMDF
ncbi:hypothetical protein KY327_01090 [Candidatus Woesearchaeota archaeon]|nr:hypothetical protein [Candidatus Woesearchaeota archaeon]